MFDYVDRIARAGCVEDVWDYHCRSMAALGFDRLIYGLTRHVGPDGDLGDPNDAFVLSNHDPAYFKRFVNERMFLDAPGLRWAAANAGAISWSALWTDAGTISVQERRVVAFNQSMGVVAGYTISFAGCAAHTFGMISLTARDGLSQDAVDTLWQTDGAQIAAMNQVFHLKMLSLPVRTQSVPLSTRQREALEWVGDGKSYRDIAAIMGVSMATVEKHLRLAREKLGVDTTAQAVLKAAFQNQLYGLGTDQQDRRS